MRRRETPLPQAGEGAERSEAGEGQGLKEVMELSMPISVNPLHPHIGAEVSGLDVATPLDDATVDAFWKAIDRHCVLVLHGQSVADAQLKGFADRFGPLESAAARCRAAGGGSTSRRLATSPISTSTA